MIISLVTAEIFSMKMLGRLLGVILTAQGVAESVSPWVMGHMRDAYGTKLCWLSCARRFGVSGNPRSLRIAKANERGMSRSRILRFALPELQHFFNSTSEAWVEIPCHTGTWSVEKTRPGSTLSGRLIFTSPYLNSAPSPRVLE